MRRNDGNDSNPDTIQSLLLFLPHTRIYGTTLSSPLHSLVSTLFFLHRGSKRRAQCLCHRHDPRVCCLAKPVETKQFPDVIGFTLISVVTVPFLLWRDLKNVRLSLGDRRDRVVTRGVEWERKIRGAAIATTAPNQGSQPDSHDLEGGEASRQAERRQDLVRKKVKATCGRAGPPTLLLGLAVSFHGNGLDLRLREMDASHWPRWQGNPPTYLPGVKSGRWACRSTGRSGQRSRQNSSPSGRRIRPMFSSKKTSTVLCCGVNIWAPCGCVLKIVSWVSLGYKAKILHRWIKVEFETILRKKRKRWTNLGTEMPKVRHVSGLNFLFFAFHLGLPNLISKSTFLNVHNPHMKLQNNHTLSFSTFSWFPKCVFVHNPCVCMGGKCMLLYLCVVLQRSTL